MSTATLTKETVTIAAIGKFGIKSGDSWFGTDKRTLKPTDFVAGQTYEVLTEPWSKNGKSGKNIVQIVGADPVTVPVAPVATLTATTQAVSKAFQSVPTANKDQRILWQGVVQAVVQSPALAGMQYTNVNEYVGLVKETASQLVAFIEEKAR